MNEPLRTPVLPHREAGRDRKQRRKAFLEGAGSILVFGRRFPVEDLTLYDALEHDFGMLWDDLLIRLVELIRHLPKDKRRELTEVLLNNDILEEEFEWHLAPSLHDQAVGKWKTMPTNFQRKEAGPRKRNLKS